MDYPTYLIHYGIPGQKWGERRWQYEDGSLTPDGYIHYGYGKRESTKQKIEYLGSRDRIRSGAATAKDIVKLNGSANISSLDSMYINYGYKIASKTDFYSLGIDKLKEINSDIDSYTKLEGNGWSITAVQPAMALKKNQPLNLDDELIMKSVTRRINPNYGEKGTTDNCVRCTTAMTLAKMGYSTPQGLSAGRSMYGALSYGFSYWFDGAQAKTIDGMDSAKKELESQPEGSFGDFSISRYDANGNRIGGHSMSYSILADGSIRIEDGQNGSIYKSVEDAMTAVGASEKQIMITRLDNTTPNMKHIAEDNMVDVGGKRNNAPTYMLKDITTIHTDSKDRSKINSYEWEKSNMFAGYNDVGTDETGRLYGRDKNRDIVYDHNGIMAKNNLGFIYDAAKRTDMISSIRTLSAAGKTQDEIARALGVSISTIQKYKNGSWW